VFILKQFDKIPFASVWSLSDDLKIPKTTAWCRLTDSLQFKCHYFEWVP
jgi:hypothetical protein